jgi:hypothetical protein
VRVTLRVQLPLAQPPVAVTWEVPRGPLAVADRVQALASAAAASDRPPMTREARKNLVMVVVS